MAGSRSNATGDAGPHARRPSGRRRLPWAWCVGAGVLACAVLGAGIAVADVPDGNTINACRNKTTFALRVIDKDASAAQTCTSSETALNWNNWKWRGAWSSATAYKIGDSVSYLGASYTAVAASTNKPPATNLTSWNVLAAKGATGAQGATGSSGVAECSGIPHFETNWTVPGSTPGNGCFFEEANLAGVQLRTSDLTNADLQRANLQGTNFIFSTLAGVNFTSADLTGASLALTQTQNAVFSGANLTGVSFHSANLTGATLSGATIDASTTFNFTGLASCKCQSMFFSALIENANADSADFSHSTLTGIKQLTLFTNVNFTGATLAANFDRSDFTGANLTNAVWFDAVCPDGTQSSSDGNSCAGHGPGL